MRKLTDGEVDFSKALSGTLKSAASKIPGVGQAIAGYDAYKKSIFERNLISTLKYLEQKVDDFDSFFSDEWFQSEDGQQFARKVFDSALDIQMEDKQELFVNTLINGIQNKDLSNLEKLKFVDILRNLSRASLMVLCDMHELYEERTKRPGRQSSRSAHIDRNKVAEELSTKYEPYLVNSCICEMESQGLFSNIQSWHKNPKGQYTSGAYFSDGLAYTDFTCRFVEFIIIQNNSEENEGD